MNYAFSARHTAVVLTPADINRLLAGKTLKSPYVYVKLHDKPIAQDACDLLDALMFRCFTWQRVSRVEYRMKNGEKLKLLQGHWLFYTITGRVIDLYTKKLSKAKTSANRLILERIFSHA